MIKDKLQKIALRHNLEINFIQSNLRRFINEKQLSLEFGINFTDSSWWGGFAHMINILGLCSLLTINKSITTLLVPISFKIIEFNLPWGDEFVVNNEVKLGFTKTVPVGHEISRFEKMELLKEYIDKNGPIPLRVCWQKPNMFNCNKCEKCARTILSLMITGVDSEQVGFKVKDPEA